MRLLLLVMILLTGCCEGNAFNKLPCITQTFVKEANCVADKYGNATCAALLENGHVIQVEGLIVKGQQVGLDKNKNHMCK